MTTITEVAKYAGVSVKTVSRVMNNYEHISPKTKARVEKAMQDLQYTPSTVARQMRLGDSLSIGMLYSDPSGGYQARLNHAVLKACSDARRYLAVELFDEKGADWVKQVEAFLDRTKVKNLILVPPMCDSTDVHELLHDRDVNFVLVSPSRPVQGALSLAMDDRLAAKEMVRHFIDLGHTKIGHISGHPGHIASLLRRQGYEEAMTKAGLSINEAYVASGRFKFREALEIADRMLSMKDRPTAIFASNDEMAAAVVMKASRLGLSIPEDLSVAGFDDTPIAQTIWPELTTVAQPFEQIANEAVKALSLQKASGGRVSETLILDHSVIVRESTGPVPQ
ncbi:MAG: LacI family transcriptional regulator [Robiginitomaculum sp.]|nr:MAG: LacI family transcriptional regulator [Robiginitomaculum sp.]